MQPENIPSSETSRSESLAGRYMPGAVGRYYTAPAPMPLPMPRFDPAAYAATYSVPITQETVAMDDSVGGGVGMDTQNVSETPKEEPELPIDRRRNDPDRLKEMLRKQRGEFSNGREETPEEKLNRLIAADHAQPFGAWTRVVVPDVIPGEQQSKVDQEVPLPPPPTETETLRPELVVTFKEKMVESIGKKSKKSSAPVEFKKRKTTIKATLRSRDSDED